MAKPKITRTYGQIHFEDLDPKRFEDLIRELTYDYKDWYKIEATGRSGNDAGFDIRAYEKTFVSSNANEDSEDNGETGISSAEGNLWMIQVKREVSIGPTRIKEILNDVDPTNPPYGYILAASSNFSKASYDVFRTELQKKGVMEFHLWGKPEIEDMLHQPKNDRILFTFFGISLVSRRRSRTTEIRSTITNKNKIFRIFGDGPLLNPVLIRDSLDTKYPYKNKYKDFAQYPRWQEFSVAEYHPLGVLLNTRKSFAYVDHIKKEYDVCDAVSLLYRRSDTDEERVEQHGAEQKVQDFWEHLPKANQAYFIEEGLLRFDEMLAIDDKGDVLYKFPHIFAEFISGVPFAGYRQYLEFNQQQWLLEDYERIEFFPKTFPDPTVGVLHKDKELKLEQHFLYRIRQGSEYFNTLYETDGRYNFLNVRDAVGVPSPQSRDTKNYIEITNIDHVKVKDYLHRNPNKEQAIQEQLGRKPNPEEIINIYEFKTTWEHKYDTEQKL